MAEKLGFRGGTVLEPAAGTGHFIGLMPESIADRSQVFAVELDSISGRICKTLYPEANTQISPFQTADITDASVDLAITNVPFANVPVHDPLLDQIDAPTKSLHDYFIAKTLTKLKPGGIQIVVTSSFTMDKANPAARQWIAENADLLAAYRLPNTAFKENAGTEVTTDILILRKKDGKLIQAAQDFVSIENTVTCKNEPISVNQYFVAHPQNIIGLLDDDGSMYQGRKAMTIHPDENRPVSFALQQALDDLPTNAFSTSNTLSGVRHKKLTSLKAGSIYKKDKLFYFAGETEPDPALNHPDNREKTQSFINFRDTLNAQYDLELSPTATDEAIETNRKKLNLHYSQLIHKKEGFHSTTLRKLLGDDPDYYRCLGAEVNPPIPAGIKPTDKALKTIKSTFVKGDIYSKRVLVPRVEPTTAANLNDALGISLGWRNQVDTAFIGSLLKLPQETVTKDLLGQSLAFLDPESGRILSREQYLAGNVRKKLEIAKTAGDNYSANVKLLEANQPTNIAIDDISFQIGSTWIPGEVYSQFLDSIGVSNVQVAYHAQAESRDFWTIEGKKCSYAPAGEYKKFATQKTPILEIFDNLLNLQKQKVTYTSQGETFQDHKGTAAAKDAADKLNERFIKWVKETPEIANQIAGLWNNNSNVFINRTYDGQHLQFPWLNKEYDIFPDKKNTIWRAIQEGRALIAHGVGGGKTIIGTSIALEMKRLGMARKPMIVVHNATLEGFANTALEMAPASRILVGSKDELEGKKRKEFLCRVATGDWDAVVIAHSTFSRIEDDPAVEIRHKENLVNEMMESIFGQDYKSLADAKNDRKKSSQTKATVKAIERLEVQIEKAKEREVDKDLLTFQQLGVDCLIVDEVHAFKKIPFASKLDVKGIDPGFSKKGYALYMRARTIQERMGGRNVFTMSGTPVTNTLGEVWNMMRLVDPKLIKDAGIEHFDQFVSKFAKIESVSELTANGDFKSFERLCNIVNLPEWGTLLRQTADIKLGDNLVVRNRPEIKGGAPELVAIQRTAALTGWVSYIRSVLDEYSKLSKQDLSDNPSLTAIPAVSYNASRCASTDIRMIDPRAKDEPGSKVNIMVDKVMELFQRTSEYNGTQVIFADSFNTYKTELFESLVPKSHLKIELDPTTPADATFNLYEDIRQKLILRGVSPHQIAVITDSAYDNDKKKEDLFKAVNQGDVRIILGSTAKLGTGVNMQERMIAAHHLDVPWMPSELEQRDGRVFRQGNLHSKLGIPIEIYRYGMKDTLDAALWQKLETKQRFITAALSGKITGRQVAEDPLTLTLAEGRAVLSGVLGQRKFELETRLYELDLSRRGYQDEAWARTGEIRMANDILPKLQADLDAAQAACAVMAPLAKSLGDAPPVISIGGSSLSGQTKTAMLEAINAELETARSSFSLSANGVQTIPPVTSISVNGIPLHLEAHQKTTVTWDDEGNRSQKVIAIEFHLVSSKEDFEKRDISFGKVTSAATLLARLEELQEVSQNIPVSFKNNLARMKSKAESLPMEPWPYQTELDTLTEELGQVNEKIQQATANRKKLAEASIPLVPDISAVEETSLTNGRKIPVPSIKLTFF